MSNGNGGDTINIPLPFGGQVSARGTLVVVVLLLLAGAYMSYLWHNERAEEHKEIINAINYQTCSTRLSLYMITRKEDVHLNQIPTELWGCLPKFVTEEVKK